MAMKRLSSLMLRKWKEKERWTGRRRSEPYGGEEEEDRTDRPIDRRMLRRKSEPYGQVEDEKIEEKKSESSRKKERRKSESSVEEEVRKDRRRTETGRGNGRRKSASCIMVEDRARLQMDSRWTPRRRSEPCGILYIQLLPLSTRKRKELLQRRTGRRTSCSEERPGLMDRTLDFRQMTRGRSEPIGPLDNSKQTA